MAHDSPRRAQREALPWMLLGFLALLVGLGLQALASIGVLEAAARDLRLAGIGRAIGALGSGGLLIGLLHLARGRGPGRAGVWMSASFALWLAELVLRLWTLADGPPFAGAPAARLLLACVAMACLSTGMLWIWERDAPHGGARTWIMSRRLLLTQLVLLLGLPVAGALSGHGATGVFDALTSALPLGLALAWLAFVGPYVHVIVSLRRTARWIAARESLVEALRG